MTSFITASFLHSGGGYLDNEMGSKVVFFHCDSAKGALHQVQVVSMLPGDFQGSSAVAEMKVSMGWKVLLWDEPV
jgi:6-phosphogluconolactonase (cycloisomerase 2 family)